MRVALLMPLAENRGGSEMMLMHLLNANHHEPQAEYHPVFFEEGAMTVQAAQMGYHVEIFPTGQLRQVGRAAAVIRRLARWMRQERFDVCMSWMGKAHLYGGPAARLAGVPAVWWQHVIPDRNWMDIWVTRLPASAIFCNSRAAEQAQKRLSPPRRTTVIYPAVDLNRFNPAALPTPEAARLEKGLPVQGPIVGIVARLQRWKGVHIFLEAAARLARSHPTATFVVVGGSHFSEQDYPEKLAEQARAAGISDRIVFAGYQADSAGWMQAFDVFVHASTSAEPFGMVITEAMALGKSVIATRAGGPLEIIEHGVDGLLVAPGDAEALAAAIALCLEDTAENRVMRKLARCKAATFSAERMSEEIARHLQEVAGQPTSR